MKEDFGSIDVGQIDSDSDRSAAVLESKYADRSSSVAQRRLHHRRPTVVAVVPGSEDATARYRRR